MYSTLHKLLTICGLLCYVHSSVCAMQDTITKKPIKTGWNFGALPSVAYDADLGFQYGALANIYYYGDGTTYPEYQHSFYVEASYTTKRSGLFRFFYDSKFLIPNHRLSVDISYIPNALCDFYGYNGYQAVYQPEWQNEKYGTEEYISRVFYKYKNDLFRVAGDMEGQICGHLKWNAGIGVLGYTISNVNLELLNKGKKSNPLPETDGLYQKYVDWGLILPEEQNGGWHPYLRGGLTYDSRDMRANPSRGIYSDLFLTYSAAFGEQQAYNNLSLNANFRHYVSIWRKDVVLAYRVGVQTLLAGKSPFYMNGYQKVLFFQRSLYEALGGANSLRGIMRNRILANGVALANIELRTRIVKFDFIRQHFYIGLAPFFDAGMVLQPYQLDTDKLQTVIAENNQNKNVKDAYSDYFTESGIYKPHMSAGIGLKAAMNENFVLSVDYALPLDKQDNDKSFNFYIKVGYLF